MGTRVRQFDHFRRRKAEEIGTTVVLYADDNNNHSRKSNSGITGDTKSRFFNGKTRPPRSPPCFIAQPQGCVVIFLSNFLALLIKVNAAGEGNRDVLGGIMVAINLLLVVAVLSSTWFAAQQSVDDALDDENPVALARTMLTFEQRAAEDARVKREERAPASSVPSSGGDVVGFRSRLTLRDM